MHNHCITNTLKFAYFHGRAETGTWIRRSAALPRVRA